MQGNKGLELVPDIFNTSCDEASQMSLRFYQGLVIVGNDAFRNSKNNLIMLIGPIVGNHEQYMIAADPHIDYLHYKLNQI